MTSLHFNDENFSSCVEQYSWLNFSLQSWAVNVGKGAPHYHPHPPKPQPRPPPHPHHQQTLNTCWLEAPSAMEGGADHKFSQNLSKTIWRKEEFSQSTFSGDFIQKGESENKYFDMYKTLNGFWEVIIHHSNWLPHWHCCMGYPTVETCENCC